MVTTSRFSKGMPPEELLELRDLYRTDWPKYAFTFYTLDNFVRWRKWFHNDDVQLYTHHHCGKSGTFVVKDHNELFFDTLSESTTELRCLLSAIVQLCGPSVSVMCRSRYREMIMDITSNASYRKTSDDRMICYRQSVSVEIDEKSDLPEAYRCEPLRRDDIAFVSQQWVHSDPSFANLPGRLIERNPSLGVYDERGQLTAWCLIDQTGSLALLQTVATHRWKGLGRAIVGRFSRMLHEGNVLPQAFVIESNTASRALFEKMRFEEVDRWWWIRFDRLGNR